MEKYKKTAPTRINSRTIFSSIVGQITLSMDRGGRATLGAKVSMRAFLACDQCWSAGSSLDWGLNLPA